MKVARGECGCVCLNFLRRRAGESVGRMVAGMGNQRIDGGVREEIGRFLEKNSSGICAGSRCQRRRREKVSAGDVRGEIHAKGDSATEFAGVCGTAGFAGVLGD